ncbi:hypothetical protein KUTeg_023580 [Tegillarca granosa]|uniref:Mab-21-like nucleotidyltransferase domain-containing protein n=1 Tax=Tegillarca granosa TaxID=220873 RepID=A0ABQ9E7N0_TEGGR|nr:hypothetical protein KUTeg_023580 [Tegillarca granosa]
MPVFFLSVDMETAVEFNPVEFDEVAEIPTLHLSFIIQSLLPVRLVGWQTTKRHYENIKSSYRIHEADAGDVIEYVLVGSIAEGYSIPNTIVKSTPPHLESFSDIDALFVNKHLKISTKPEYDKGAFKGYCDFSESHPGYLRVCLPTVKEQDEIFIYDKDKNIYYMSSKAQQEKGFHNMKDVDIGAGRIIDAHGPAISLEYTVKPTIYDWKEKNAGLSQDIVLALPCYPWPEVAKEWKSRGLKSAWLDNDFVQSIIDDGCHVVAVPHRKSSYPDIEWRLSFSASEGRLGREAVTDSQRQCFIFMKILRHQFTDNRLIGLQPATLDFRQINECLLIDIKAFKQHRDIQKSVNEGVFVAAFSCCLLLLLEETKQSDAQQAKYKEAVYCIIDIFPFMRKYLYPEMKLVDLLNLTGISIPDLKRSVHFYEAAVEMIDAFPDFLNLRDVYMQRDLKEASLILSPT